LGVVHDYIAHQTLDLARVLPERRATRSYWSVIHEDMRGLGRIKAVYNHMVGMIERDKRIFL
jgi:hypothetical protein